MKLDVTGDGNGAGGPGGSKQGKKTTGILSGILGKIGIIAIILQSFSDVIKPVLDFLKIGANFLVLFILWAFRNLPKWLGSLDEWLKGIPGKMWELTKKGFTWIRDKLIEGWNVLTTWLSKIWNSFIEWIASLPGKIWEFLKNLPMMIWDFLKGAFNLLVETLKFLFFDLPGKLWDALTIGFDWIVSNLSALWKLTEKFRTGLVEKTKQVIDWIKNLPKGIWESIKSGFTWIRDKVSIVSDFINKVWNAIKDLPGKIWDAIQGLPRMIAEAFTRYIPFFGGGARREGSFGRSNVKKGSDGVYRVGDAIMRPNGDVIETDPDDTLIALKNLNGSNMGGSTNVINFYGVTYEQAIAETERRLAINVNNSSRF